MRAKHFLAVCVASAVISACTGKGTSEGNRPVASSSAFPRPPRPTTTPSLSPARSARLFHQLKNAPTTAIVQAGVVFEGAIARLKVPGPGHHDLVVEVKRRTGPRGQWTGVHISADSFGDYDVIGYKHSLKKRVPDGAFLLDHALASARLEIRYRGRALVVTWRGKNSYTAFSGPLKLVFAADTSSGGRWGDIHFPHQTKLLGTAYRRLEIQPNT